MRYVLCVEGKSIASVQETILSMIEHISTPIVRSKNIFTVIMKSLLRYTREFEETYGVWFVDLRTMDIVENAIPSNFLADSSRATHIRYIIVGKMTTKYPGVLLLLGRLSKDARAANIVGITNVDDSSLYITSDENSFS